MDRGPPRPPSALRKPSSLVQPPMLDAPIAVSEAKAPVTCGTATIQGVERLVLRAAPGLASEKLADDPAGTVATLACDPPLTADGLVWQPAQVNDREGWMSQRMLR